MTSITSVARFLFAIAMLAFGIQHLVYGEFVTRVVPKLSARIPWHPVWAYATGLGLILAAGAILFKRRAKPAAALIGIFILLSFLVFYLPALFASPPLGPLWTNAGKALALSGGAFLVAASLARADAYSPSGAFPNARFLTGAVLLSRIFLSAFLIVAGIQHFLFISFVASLVPAWIPGHVFWAYFAGIALLAGGIGMLIPRVARLAASLSGIMILLWVVLLHIPRALAAPRDANETTAVFEALAIGAAALLLAGQNSRSERQWPA